MIIKINDFLFVKKINSLILKIRRKSKLFPKQKTIYVYCYIFGHILNQHKSAKGFLKQGFISFAKFMEQQICHGIHNMTYARNGSYDSFTKKAQIIAYAFKTFGLESQI